MIIEEKGQLYDIHEECANAGVCDSHRAKNEFTGCQYIAKGAAGFYCLTKPQHPSIKLNAIWIEYK